MRAKSRRDTFGVDLHNLVLLLACQKLEKLSMDTSFLLALEEKVPTSVSKLPDWEQRQPWSARLAMILLAIIT